jgi:acyl dehydratase
VSEWIVGDSLPVLVLDEVRESDIFLTALLLRDPNPIHWDLGAVRAAGLGDRYVNQGGATMAIVMNMLQRWAHGDRSALRRVSCRFRGNVFAGDRIEVSGIITAIHPAGDTADDVVDIEVDVAVEAGGRPRVLVGTATVRIPA